MRLPRCPIKRRMNARFGRRVVGCGEPFSRWRLGRNAHRSHIPGVHARCLLKGFFTSIELQNAIVKNVELRGGEYFLLIFMSRWAQDDGTRVFPSVLTLARDSRQHERNVRRQLKSLEAKGFIQYVGQSKRGTDSYRIVLEKCYPQGVPPAVRSTTLAQRQKRADIPAKEPGTAPADSLRDSSKNRQELLATPHVKPVSYAVEMVLKSLKNRPVKESP